MKLGQVLKLTFLVDKIDIPRQFHFRAYFLIAQHQTATNFLLQFSARCFREDISMHQPNKYENKVSHVIDYEK